MAVPYKSIVNAVNALADSIDLKEPRHVHFDDSVQSGAVSEALQELGWRKRKAAEASIAGLTVAEVVNGQASIAGIFKPETTLMFVAIFNDEKDKRRFFPEAEKHGYRMYREFGVCALFFYVQGKVAVLEQFPAGAEEVRSSFNTRRWLNSEYIIENSAHLIRLDARQLLRSVRFDIVIKAHYARLYSMQAAKEWREFAYREHIMRITGRGRTVKEHDGSGKEGLETFLNGFHSLIEEKDKTSFPRPPIDCNGIALDGAHRIAACVNSGDKVTVLKFDAPMAIDSGYEFFNSFINGHPPCPSTITDEALIEYCRVKNSAGIALLFPSATYHDFGVAEIARHAEVICQKEITITPKAGGALLRQIYAGQPWLDWSGENSGFKHKRKRCFPYVGKMTVVLFDRYDIAGLRDLKERVRAHYRLDNHSIHITDSTEETLQAAQLLFNKNSLDVLASGTGNFAGFHEKLFRLKKWISDNNLDVERICVDSSAVLSVMGIRECRDIDFLFHGDAASLPETPEAIDCHNDHAYLYDRPIDQIIGDPRLHFWYMGVKFCAPNVVLSMKKRRGERKDVKDVRALKAKLPKASSNILSWTYNLVLVRIGLVMARVSAIRRKIKRLIKGR